MTIGLNIGCGRATFPTTRENQFTSHLMYAINIGCPQALDPSVEWVNIDRIAGPNIQEVINVFRFPFLRSTNGKPFDDNFADIIWMSHIIEHIPHAITLANYDGEGGGIDTHRAMFERDGDAWFSFFYECWRILKPGGRMAITFPYGNSVAGISDPTHTRYILPPSFGYFLPNPDAPFDYAIPFQFRQLTDEHDIHLPSSGLLKIINESNEIKRRIEDLRIQIIPMTADDPKRPQMIETLKEASAYFENFLMRHFNQVEECFFVFEALK